MQRCSRQSGIHLRVSRAALAASLWLIAAAAQQPAHPADDLGKRIAAAGAARDAGDPSVIAVSNQRLIATAMRRLAALRMVEGAYAQAAALDRTSLGYEDTAAARLDLAMAEAQAGQLDDSLTLARQAQAAGSGDPRIDRILASALVQKGQFADAVAPFTRIAHAEPTIENLYALANCLLETRRPEDKVRAQAVFAQLAQVAGDSGSLHVLMGRAYRDAGDMPSALHEFERAVQIDTRTPHAHYFLGLAQLALNEWKPTPQAEAEIAKEAEYFPRDYLANYMLGFLFSEERRYDEANRYLEAAARIDSSAPEPFLFLGLNAYAQQDAGRAEPMLRKAVELTGNDESRSNYQIRRAYVELGRILTNSGRKDEAEVFLAKARDLQNKTMQQSQQSIATMAAEGGLAGGSGALAGIVPLSRSQDHAAAAPLDQGVDLAARIDIPAKLDPQQRKDAGTQETLLRATLGLAYNDLATSEAVRGDFPRALRDYQQAERWDTTLPGLAKNLGLCAFRAGDYPEAISSLAVALAQLPGNAAVRGMLGIAYFETNQFAAAAQTFAPLGSQGMADSEIGYAWASSLAHTGDMKQAAQVLSAFQLQPRPADTLLLIGQLWTEIGDYARAVSACEQALASDASLPRAHYYAGLAYLRWEHWSEASNEFQAELAIHPDEADAQYHLGYVAMQQARTDDASKLFRQVIAAHPEYANAQYQLGKILLDRGQAADAVGYLEAAARLSPQTDYIHYQLQAAYRKQDRIAEADRELDVYKQLKAKSRERDAQAIRAAP